MTYCLSDLQQKGKEAAKIKLLNHYINHAVALQPD